jgi:hypothetical protein
MEPRPQIPLGKPARIFLVTHISIATASNIFKELINKELTKKMIGDTVITSPLMTR